ncbi:hypothetical protein [Lentzea sp.]|uniref:hypothetical protein n=1 Tax=Lentzea sp. TaxID=56099 RepID=UPI002ED22182
MRCGGGVAAGAVERGGTGGRLDDPPPVDSPTWPAPAVAKAPAATAAATTRPRSADGGGGSRWELTVRVSSVPPG